MDTIEVTFELHPKDPWSEIFIAHLADEGFDSFVNTDLGFMAYGNSELDLDQILLRVLPKENEELSVKHSSKIIPHQNWNATWEENFEPVYVENHASILAPFHPKENAKGLIVEIQPAMSFGTGHHQTTWMMTKALFELDAIPINVLDMGTGTGVLAIVAEKLGAKKVWAIDIEDWSAENAKENAGRNNCQNIKTICGDLGAIPNEDFGLILANINKNVLKLQMQRYSDVLVNGGILILSGFFVDDVKEMISFCNDLGFTLDQEYNRDEWAALKLIKSN